MDYYKSNDFLKHREKINTLLEKIPSAQSPKGWTRTEGFSIGGFEYFGFAESSDILVVLSSQGRGLIDMAKNEKIARDYAVDDTLDETLLTTKGFDVLEGETIKLASRYGGSMLPVRNKSGESLIKVSPLYPSDDIIFQPPYECCFADGRYKNSTSKNCVRIYRGFLYCYGFSFSGKYFVIADDGGLTYWEANLVP